MTPESEKYAKIGKFDKRSAQNHANLRNLIFPRIPVDYISTKMCEKFSLKWNDFHSNVSKSFSLLRNEDYLHDVTIVSDDNEQVTAHKLILSTCSEYFKSIFMKNKHSHPLICLEGVSSNDVRNMKYDGLHLQWRTANIPN